MSKDIKPKMVIILSDPVNARFLPKKIAMGVIANGNSKKMTSY